MYGRSGLDRFKKSQSLEPFSVSADSASSTATLGPKNTGASEVGQTQHVGEGQSSWQPPDWAIEPRAGVFYLEIVKDGQILDKIQLDRRRHIFGRQHQTCDFVLDHQSVSRQHAAVVPHKNGSIFVIDLGSAHGTFVANERLTKETPVELEVGQSLRFAASTRTYILRKNNAALFPRPPPPAEIKLPQAPDPADEDAVVAYNTLLNRYGLTKPDGNESERDKRAAKRIKKLRVAFRDQSGGELVEIVGISDGVDVGTEPGPVGVKEGSLVGKYESLVQVTVIPKGKEQQPLAKELKPSPGTGVTDRLQEALKKVKSNPKSGIYDDLYGDSVGNVVGKSWAKPAPPSPPKELRGDSITSQGVVEEDKDDLFGD
ncbi:PREDICTED: nuclear inhibitor of protein phosphatase 1 [Tarenaya hassleriana]|uniref:nuclear inhibitor of protein phosphatase 1 n=1 Tax=Tarenaya hassleriana TaxID=28532 RepID=UPI00053C24A5|nr:PREDICTED: nuclear inhibitor of protein phosphatase 1 [Tarenaya hassleriana]